MARQAKRTIQRGDGYIVNRATVSGDMRYMARWHDGERWRARTFASNDDAEDHLRLIGRSKRSGSYVSDSELTIADLVAEHLERGRVRWSSNTVATYTTIAANQIVPMIGDLKVVDATPRRMQRWIDDLGHSFGPSRIGSIRAVMTGAFREAMQLGVINRDPLQGVRMPKRQRVTRTVWSASESARIINHTQDNIRLHAWYVVALSTGMRPGELRALQWQDITWEAGSILCRRTMTRDHRYSPVIGTTTKGGRERSIAVPDDVIVALTRLRKDQAERRLRHDAWQDHQLVFDRGNGAYMPQQTIQRWHVDASTAAGVPVIRMHDLRHTAATLMLESGIHPKVVSEMLGHRDITITLDIYTHVSKELQRQAATSMGAILRGEHLA